MNTTPTLANLLFHVIGGQQLTWPPLGPPKVKSPETTEETKEEKPKLTIDDVYTQEMGLSLIIEAMIEQKKPIIGHNCFFDWAYVYN